MSIFEHRKPAAAQMHRDSIQALRETLEHLNAEPEELPRIADLKRILTARIHELERKSA